MKKRLWLRRFMGAALALLAAIFAQIPAAQAAAKTFTAVGEYTMSDYETPDVAEQRAFAYAKQRAAEEAGVYVTSYTKSVGAQISEDQVNLLAGTLLQVKSREKRMERTATGDIHIIVEISADVDTAAIDEALARMQEQNNGAAKMYADLQRDIQRQEQEIEELKQKIAALRAKGESTEALVKESKAQEREFLSNQKVDESYKFMSEGKIEEHLAAANEAIRLNPKNARAYNSRGIVFAKKGQYHAAIDEFTKAVTVNPKFSMGYFNRGRAYDDKRDSEASKTGHGMPVYDKKDTEAAIANYTKAIETFTGHNLDIEDTLIRRGIANWHIFQNDAAISDFSEALVINPNRAFAYGMRGLNYMIVGRFDKAIDDLKTALRLEPNTEIYLEWLQLAHYGKQNGKINWN